MLIDVDTRKLIADERVVQLQLDATGWPRRRRRTRQWVAEHLIAAGERLRPETPAPARG